MFKKTIAAAAVGAGSLLAVAAPASATDPGENEQIGLVNINNFLNNACLLPWNDGNVLAGEVPILSPDTYQACNEGKVVQ